MFHNLISDALNYYEARSNDAKFLSKLFKYSLALMLFTYLPFPVILN